MIEFNSNNKINKTNFKAKLNEEKFMEPIKEFLSKILQRAEFEVTDVGAFQPIEMLGANPNKYQEVEKFGFRIRPASPDHNSKERILELAATKKSATEKTTTYLEYARGTRDEILAKLKNPKLTEDLDNFVKDASKKFFAQD